VLHSTGESFCAAAFKSTELFFYILLAENGNTYMYKIFSAVVSVDIIYEGEGYLECNFW
jgi:hypothetical protein